MNERITRTVQALCRRGFEAYAAETAQEALDIIRSMIPHHASITWGGSATLAEIGLTDVLKGDDYLVYDRDDVPAGERLSFYKEHFFCDWYLMSSNAITEDGELLNLDGTGNRVASLVFGPQNVLIVAGINKIVPCMEDAYTRVRTVAAPRNAQRFPINTPCKKTGSCADCKSPDTICCSMVRTRFCRPNGRIKVVLIDQVLGF